VVGNIVLVDGEHGGLQTRAYVCNYSY